MITEQQPMAKQFQDFKGKWWQWLVPGTSPIVITAIKYPETWQMAYHPLTWIIGRQHVTAKVKVTSNGTVIVHYSFKDATIDLKVGADKSETYKKAAKLGEYWPGNQEMKMDASWTKTY